MGEWAARYTPEEREAVNHAYVTRGVRPARRVAEMAAAGELTLPGGAAVEPFEVPAVTVRSMARDKRKRLAGRTAVAARLGGTARRP